MLKERTLAAMTTMTGNTVGKTATKRSLFPLLRNKVWLQARDTVNIEKERRRISNSTQVPVTLQGFHVCSFCLEKPKEMPVFK